jgi:hypothetical protein
MGSEVFIKDVSELHFNEAGVTTAVFGKDEDRVEIGIDFMDTFLQEATGKFDRDGFMIYSGDVLEIAEKHYNVGYIDGAFRAMLVEDNGMTESLLNESTAMNAKIVGNIFKNKEIAEPKVDFSKVIEDKLNEKKEE